ncbi:MAG: class I SAM-dependent methyltransferase [Nanoarchaeota archaeon]
MNNNGKTTSNPWWSDQGGFFGAKYIEGDDSLTGYLPEKAETLEERTKREVDGVISLLDLKERYTILDCPCGYGRHSIELGKRKMIVTGVDINPSFTGKAFCEAHEQFWQVMKKLMDDKRTGEAFDFGERYCPRFLLGDMRHLIGKSPAPQFNAVINMFYSFGFFETEAENEAVMKEFYDCLKPNGQFLLHTDVSPEIINSGNYQFSETRNLKSGKKLKIAEVYNLTSKRMQGSWTLICQEGREEQLTPYSVRIYSKEELEALAKRTGFRETKFYGSFSGDNFTDSSQEMIMVARK